MTETKGRVKDGFIWERDSASEVMRHTGWGEADIADPVASDHKPIALYVLVDPVTYAVRYAGQTRQTLGERLNGHITEALRNVGRDGDTDPIKTAWICSLLARSERPLIRLVWRCREEWANEVERDIIRDLWVRGADLVNIEHTPRAWCAGESADSCPSRDRHRVTCVLSHDLYIDFRLHFPYALEEALEELATLWLYTYVYERDERIAEAQADQTRLETTPLGPALFEKVVSFAAEDGRSPAELLTDLLIDWFGGSPTRRDAPPKITQMPHADGTE